MLWREIFEAGVYAPAAAHLRSGDTVLDVGAHTGLSALYFGTQAADVRVLAFEPAAATHACLSRNLAEHLGAARPVRAAVGEQDGETDFVYYPQAPSQSGRYADRAADDRLTMDYLLNNGLEADQAAYLCAGLHEGQAEKVPLRSISSILAEHRIDHVGVLKIDVERAEFDVLSGVAEADWPRIRTVVAEVHDTDGGLDRCLGLLTGQGFDASSCQESWLTGSELHTVLAVRRP